MKKPSNTLIYSILPEIGYLTIPIEKYFNNHNTRQILSDKNGNIYLTSDDPFPHVEKFSNDLRDENGNVIMQ